jgi:hypothetical protein
VLSAHTSEANLQLRRLLGQFIVVALLPCKVCCEISALRCGVDIPIIAVYYGQWGQQAGCVLSTHTLEADLGSDIVFSVEFQIVQA